MLESEIPGILIAMPTLDNTYFEKSIILLCNYNAEGAFGLIMNRPSSTKVEEILSPELNSNNEFNIPVLIGGPVEPDSFWAIHTSDISIENLNICIKKHPGMFLKAHPDRYINNLYFDTVGLDNYWNNVDGTSQRLKV